MKAKGTRLATERRPQRRSLDTRDKILAAALVEFASHGFSGASTRAVAKLAGVQHPLLSYHFKSKEGLWRALLAATGGHFMERFNARLAGLRGVDDVTKLLLVQEEFVRFSAENPHFHMLMSQEARRSSRQLKWLLQKIIKPYFLEVTALIRSAQRAGRYVNGEPHHLQYLFIGAATRIFTLAVEVEVVIGRSPFSPKMIDNHVAACLSLFFRKPSDADKAAPSRLRRSSRATPRSKSIQKRVR